jgi:hypothetical protein
MDMNAWRIFAPWSIGIVRLDLDDIGTELLQPF